MIELIVKKPTVELNASLGGYKEGYEIGYGVGYEEGYNEGYGEGEFDGYQTGEQVGYQEGYDEGNAEGLKEGHIEAYDAFWDMFQKNGTRTEYRYAFAYTDWTEELFKPKYPFKLAGDNTYAFLGVQAVWEDKVFEVDTSEATSLYWAFRLTKFKRIGKCDLSSATAINAIFSICSNLVSIEEIVSHEGLDWANAFDWSSNLEEIRFSGVIGKNISFSTNGKLSNDTVKSIINALKDLRGATAQTLTLHADVKNKLTTAQRNAIQAKNWILA